LRTGTLQSICKKTNNAAEAETAAVMPELQVQEKAGMCWQKPETGRYKCNIDVSFSDHRNRVGFGMCICHDEGHCMLLAKTL
jgi:hypothetical protein